MTAGLDGFRGSRPYQLVGIGIPLRRSGFSRSVGSTDCAITCFFTLASLRRAAGQLVMLRLLRVDRGPVCS